MNDSSLSLGKLPKPQKIAVFVLAVLAVLIIVFWVWQMQAQINRPFADRTVDNTAFTATSTDTDINTILKNRDTDSDGLSDYDELYTYKTSPYLEDTDSDGISDKKEIEQGTNPICPQGQNCNVEETATNTQTTTNAASTLIPNQVSTSTSDIDPTALQNAANGQIDATTLRKLLISGGASKETLDKISDTDLMKSYQETLNKQSQTQ